jgi:hypothetical protein
MKKASIALIACLLSASCVYNVQPLAPTTYADYGFSVDFPSGRSKLKTQDYDSTFGHVKRTELLADQLNLLTGNVSPCTQETYFIVRFYDLPAQYQENGPSDLLRMAKADVLKDQNLSLLTEKEIQLNGHPGVELTIEGYKGAAFLLQRIYLRDHKIYTQLVSTTRKQCLADEKNVQFMNSLQFTS